jgi:acylphosphatase
MKRFHIFVSGRVQGVFFRGNTVRIANNLGVTGWVRNLTDGRVEIVAQGSEEKLKEFIEWIKKGPDDAGVVDLVIKEEKLTSKFNAFKRKQTL